MQISPGSDLIRHFACCFPGCPSHNLTAVLPGPPCLYVTPFAWNACHPHLWFNQWMQTIDPPGKHSPQIYYTVVSALLFTSLNSHTLVGTRTLQLPQCSPLPTLLLLVTSQFSFSAQLLRAPEFEVPGLIITHLLMNLWEFVESWRPLPHIANIFIISGRGGGQRSFEVIEQRNPALRPKMNAASTNSLFILQEGGTTPFAGIL